MSTIQSKSASQQLRQASTTVNGSKKKNFEWTWDNNNSSEPFSNGRHKNKNTKNNSSASNNKLVQEHTRLYIQPSIMLHSIE
jgi:hypothetical protein